MRLSDDLESPPSFHQPPSPHALTLRLVAYCTVLCSRYIVTEAEALPSATAKMQSTVDTTATEGPSSLPVVDSSSPPLISRLEGLKDPPRLVVRNLPFNQSRNVLQVEHNQGLKITRLTLHDFFHVLLRLPSAWTVLVFLILWTSSCLFFAALLYAIDPPEAGTECRLRSYDKPILYATAFAQSIQTASGVGYT